MYFAWERIATFLNSMKLLIITQKVDKNDDVLGFFHAWITEFAKHCEKVTVICLQKGEYDLPENVKVFSLGKENGESRLKYVFRFYRHIWQERKNYDDVFVHMNPEYVVLGGPLWRVLGKRILLWYTHRNVDLKLRIAEKFAHRIFTSAKESFLLPTKKLSLVGHGVDVAKFKRPENFIRATQRTRLEIISVGRIAPIKNLETLIEACAILKATGVDFRARIAGAPAARDSGYFQKLKKIVAEKQLTGKVEFTGSISHKDIAPYYWESDFEINLCPTGGVDKAVLEAMAAGAIPIVSNAAFATYFGDYSKSLLFQEGNAKDLSEKILTLLHSSKQEEVKKFLEEKAGEFDTPKIVQKIISLLIR